MSEPESSTRVALGEFVDRAAAIWDRYRDAGPGSVDAQWYDGMPALADALKSAFPDDAPELPRAVATLRDLSERCACRPEGLCFITGEAGLIPRRDLHEAFETALATLRRKTRR